MAAIGILRWLFVGFLTQLPLATVSQQHRAREPNQKLAMEPQDQIAIVGTTVILPCRVVNKQGVLQWTKDSFGLGTRRKLAGFERYSMIGSDEEGDYSLRISPVMLDDDAEYQCQVSPGAQGQPAIRSRYAKLSVLVAPDAPQITQGEHLSTTEDRDVELECVSRGGKPAAEITWIDGGGNVLTSGVEYIKEMLPDMRRFTARSILKLKARKDHHNTSIVCQAQNTADKTYRSTHIKLEVQYAPKVSISIVDGVQNDERIPEGATIRFVCDIQANPDEVTYRWFLNEEVISTEFPEMTIANISRDYNNAVVKCEAQNPVGVSVDTEILDVSYPPVFIQTPKSVQAELNEEVSLVCEVDSNPPAEIVWVYDPIDRLNFHPRVVGITSGLKITASNETAGRYYCKASAFGYPEISAESIVHLKGPPKILSMQAYTDTDNQTSRIECVALAIPKARHISWAVNGRVVETLNDINVYVYDEPLADGVKSTLVMFNTTAKHFGRYTCSVINKFGAATSEILFNADDEVPMVLLYAIGGGVTFVLISVGLGIVLCCLKTRRKRPPQPADIIPKEVNPPPVKKLDYKIGKTTTDLPEPDCVESHSGSYSTTTTLSLNKNELLNGSAFAVRVPVDMRYSGNYIDHNQSYVDYARDYYSPTTQTFTGYSLQLQKENPTYV